MPLKLRLTLLYLAFVTPSLIVVGIAVFLIFQHEEYASVDSSLEEQTQAIKAALAHPSAPMAASDIERNRAALDRLASLGMTFQLYGEDGRLLFSSAGGTSYPLPDSLPGTPVEGFERRPVVGVDSRTLTEPVFQVGQVIGFVEARSSLTQSNTAIRNVRNILLAGGAAILAATAGVAYFVAGRAVDPVIKVTKLAAEIVQTVDFTRRLPSVRSAAEMVALTATFNALIDRIDRLLQAQRDFLADSSHELRRPLTILRTNIDIMNDPRLSDSDREAIEADMKAEAELMSSLIAKLLILSRQAEKPAMAGSVDLSALCKAELSRAAMLGGQHEFVDEIADGIVIDGDRAYLTQLLDNLLQNAITYTPGKGRIRLGLSASDGHAIVEVEDNGIGLTPSDAAKAFDRFFRSEAARALNADGFGLGLSIVKQVVDAHGGEVRIQGRPGAGTTVRVSLPLVRIPAIT